MDASISIQRPTPLMAAFVLAEPTPRQQPCTKAPSKKRRRTSVILNGRPTRRHCRGCSFDNIIAPPHFDQFPWLSRIDTAEKQQLPLPFPQRPVSPSPRSSDPMPDLKAIVAETGPIRRKKQRPSPISIPPNAHRSASSSPRRTRCTSATSKSIPEDLPSSAAAPTTPIARVVPTSAVRFHNLMPVILGDFPGDHVRIANPIGSF